MAKYSNIYDSKIEDNTDKRAIAIYGRVSTREQAEYGFSVRDQRDKIVKYLDYLDEDGNTKNRVFYLDEGKSAKSLKRKEMKRLLEDVKLGKIKAVIIHNLDRWTRNMRDFMELIELFERYDVELISLREEIKTKSAMGKFLVYVIVLIAELERETTSERTKRGMDRSAQEGNYSISRLPIIGYKRTEEKKLMIDYSTSEVVEMIFNMIAAGAYSARALAKFLNGHKITEHIRWNDRIIQNIVRNPIFYGAFINDRICIEEHSPKIIEKETWDKANKELNKRARRPRYKYLYKGLVKCKDCDEIAVAECGTSSTGKVYFYYKCKTCRKRFSERMISEKLNIELNELVTRDKIKKITRETNKKINIIQSQIEMTDDLKAINKLETKIEKERRAANKIKEASVYEWRWLEYGEARKLLVSSKCNIEVSANSGTINLRKNG